jgi:hypothetical protein
MLFILLLNIQRIYDVFFSRIEEKFLSLEIKSDDSMKTIDVVYFDKKVS